MITFIFYKMLMFAYSFEKETADVCAGIFAFFSTVEFVLVIIFTVTNFEEIVTFIKELKKESKGLEK